MKIDNYTNHQILKAFKAACECDSFLCEEEWLNRYEYHENWSDNFIMAKFDNGSGNDLFVLSCGDSLVLKGFDHESQISPHARDEYEIWPEMYKGLPLEFESELQDDALTYDEVTFCCWRTQDIGLFQQGPVDLQGLDNGLSYLVGNIFFTAEEYIKNSENYFEGLTPEQKEKIAEIYINA